MASLKKQLGQLYEDAVYFHLIRDGSKVIKNQHGLFLKSDYDKENYTFLSRETIKRILKKR